MPKCRNCKWMIGYDVISGCFICNATNDIDYVEPDWAEDDELGCDLYVDNNISDNSAKKP